MISELGDQIMFAQQAGAGMPSLEATCQLQSSLPGLDRQSDSPMADLNSSLESSVLSTEETSTTTSTCQATVAAALSIATTSSSGCETMMWEGWLTSPHPCTTSTDEASTSNALHPTSGSISSFQHQSDMLSNMLSSFHPLAVQSSDDNGGGFLHEAEPLDSDPAAPFGGSSSKSFTYLSGVPCPGLRKRDSDQGLSPFSYSKPMSTLWPDSPSPSRPGEFMKSWDSSNPVHVPWPTTTTTIQLFHDTELENYDQGAHIRNMNYANKSKLELFGNSSTPCETNHLVSSPNSFLSMPPSAWTSSTPETSYAPGSFAMSESPATSRSQQFLDFVRIAQDPRAVMGSESSVIPVDHANSNNPPRRNGKHRCDDLVSTASASKRQHLVDDHGVARAALRFGGGLYASSSGGGAPSASQAMELFAIGPALNTNGKPRARRGSATDPQSVYARHRREKINERLKTLQHLVPNGAKVDIVTMLDEAVHYVQFLQDQVKLLKSNENWILATPNSYKGIDLTNPLT